MGEDSLSSLKLPQNPQIMIPPQVGGMNLAVSPTLLTQEECLVAMDMSMYADGPHLRGDFAACISPLIATGATVHAHAALGIVNTVAVVAAGALYCVGDVLLLAGGLGCQVSVTAVNASGGVTAISLGAYGTGYADDATVATTTGRTHSYITRFRDSGVKRILSIEDNGHFYILSADTAPWTEATQANDILKGPWVNVHDTGSYISRCVYDGSLIVAQYSDAHPRRPYEVRSVDYGVGHTSRVIAFPVGKMPLNTNNSEAHPAVIALTVGAGGDVGKITAATLTSGGSGYCYTPDLEVVCTVGKDAVITPGVMKVDGSFIIDNAGSGLLTDGSYTVNAISPWNAGHDSTWTVTVSGGNVTNCVIVTQAFSDLVIVGSTHNRIQSASYALSSMHIGTKITIASGTNWTPGEYTIVSAGSGYVTVSGVANISTSTAATGGTGTIKKEGGTTTGAHYIECTRLNTAGCITTDPKIGIRLPLRIATIGAVFNQGSGYPLSDGTSDYGDAAPPTVAILGGGGDWGAWQTNTTDWGANLTDARYEYKATLIVTDDDGNKVYESPPSQTMVSKSNVAGHTNRWVFSTRERLTAGKTDLFLQPTPAYIGVYRRKYNFGKFHFVGMKAIAATDAWGTWTFIDNVAEADLGIELLTENVTYPPPCKYVATWKDRVWYAHTSNSKAQILGSETNDHTYVKPGNYNPSSPTHAIEFRIQDASDEEIMGMVDIGDALWIATRTACYVITGDSALDFSLSKVSKEGLSAHYAFDVYENRVIWLSSTGVMAWGLQDEVPSNISKKVWPSIQKAFRDTGISYCSLMIAKGFLYLYAATSTYPQLVMSFDTGAWSTWTPTSGNGLVTRACCVATSDDLYDFLVPYGNTILSYGGHLAKSLAGGYLTTRAYNFGEPDRYIGVTKISAEVVKPDSIKSNVVVSVLDRNFTVKGVAATMETSIKGINTPTCRPSTGSVTPIFKVAITKNGANDFNARVYEDDVRIGPILVSYMPRGIGTA